MNKTRTAIVVMMISFLTACYGPSKTKGQEVNECMANGGTPEECDRSINTRRSSSY